MEGKRNDSDDGSIYQSYVHYFSCVVETYIDGWITSYEWIWFIRIVRFYNKLPIKWLIVLY